MMLQGQREKLSWHHANSDDVMVTYYEIKLWWKMNATEPVDLHTKLDFSWYIKENWNL